MAQAAETIVRRWFEEVWNQKRESAIDELMADDALVHGIVGPDGKEIRGSGRLQTVLPAFLRGLSGYPHHRRGCAGRWRQGCRALRGDRDAYRTWRDWPRPPTSLRDFTGMCIVRVENGKIVEGWNNFDFLSMYQQLGMQLS